MEIASSTHRMNLDIQRQMYDDSIITKPGGWTVPESDDVDHDEETNPNGLHVTESELRYKRKDDEEGEYSGHPGLGVVNNYSPLSKGTILGYFNNPEHLTWAEASRRIASGIGEYIILPTQAKTETGPYLDFHKAVNSQSPKERCIMSRVNAPGGLINPSTRTRATANCSLHSHKTKDGEFIVYLKASRKIKRGEELLYNYGNSYKITLHEKESSTHINYGAHVYKELDELDLELIKRICNAKGIHNGYTLMIPSSCYPIFSHELRKAAVRKNKREIARLLKDSIQFYLMREVRGPKTIKNRGSGFCSYESLYTAHCSSKENQEEEIPDSSSTRAQRYARIGSFCEQMKQELETNFPIDVRPPEIQEIVRKLTVAGASTGHASLPVEYWLSTTNLPVLDTSTPKAVWTGQMEGRQETSEYEIVETISNYPDNTYRFTYEQLSKVMNEYQHIRYRNSHFESTVRQSGLLYTLDRLVENLASSIYIIVKERMSGLGLHNDK